MRLRAIQKPDGTLAPSTSSGAPLVWADRTHAEAALRPEDAEKVVAVELTVVSE